MGKLCEVMFVDKSLICVGVGGDVVLNCVWVGFVGCGECIDDDVVIMCVDVVFELSGDWWW